jgi:hypothetical protein
MLENKVDQFLSLIGAVTGTPLTFLIPALFHYKANQIIDKKEEKRSLRQRYKKGVIDNGTL